MSSVYTAIPGNVSPNAAPTITIPSDGDVATAASINVALQKINDTLALIQTKSTIPLFFGGASTTADTTSRYCRPGFTSAAIDTTEVYVVAPLAGKISNMYIKCTTGSTTQGWTVFVRKNTANTTITATVAAAATTGSDLVDSATVAAGDLLSVSLVGVAGITVAPVNFIISFLYTMA